MHARRERIAIIAEILSLGRNPVNKTRIMYEANLSYSMSRKYIGELLSLGLLEQCSPQVRTTEKGANFLKKYYELMDWMGQKAFT